MPFLKYNARYALLFFLLLAFFRLPDLIVLPDPTLDSSWMIGLHYATLHGWQFGRDLLYTFGPLHYLWSPLPDGSATWGIAVVFRVVMRLLFLATIFRLLAAKRAPLVEIVIVSCLTAFALPYVEAEYEALLVAGVWLFIALSDGPVRLPPVIGWTVIAVASLLLAVASLIKFTALVAALAMIAVVASVILYKRKYRLIALGPLFFIIALPALWSLSGQRLGALPAYLALSLNASSGYNEAMSISGLPEELWAGVTTLGVLFGLLVRAIWKREGGAAFFLLLFAGPGFVLFKHGFVRHDAHCMIFFGSMVLLMLLYLLVWRASAASRWWVAGCCALLAGFIVKDSLRHDGGKAIDFSAARRVAELRTAWSVAAVPGYAAGERERAAGAIRKTFALSGRAQADLAGKPLDIFPWDISLAWAYGLDWRPRLTLQSFAAYTPELDRKNALHFRQAQSPRVLYAFKSMNGRYAAFDEPQTFAELLLRYRFDYAADTEFLVLVPDSIPPARQERIVATVAPRLGEPVGVPMSDRGYLFAAVTIRYSLIGKFRNLLFKPPELAIAITTADGRCHRHRFIPRVAGGGLFVSQYIGDIRALRSIYEGTPDPSQRIVGFTIGLTRPEVLGRFMYRDRFSVVFRRELLTRPGDNGKPEEIEVAESSSGEDVQKERPQRLRPVDAL